MAIRIPKSNFGINIPNNVPTPLTEEIVALASRAIRFKVISDRYTRGFQVADVDGPPGAYENSGISMFATEGRVREQRLAEAKIGRQQINNIGQSDYVSEPSGQRQIRQPLADSISIVDIDYKDSQKRTRGYSYITLPFVPRELSYEASSKFIGIATIGRNNPFYQFTGSEDTLQFDIDWFSNQNDRQDVINSCRWVEALSKSDGYDDLPHRIKLVWGLDDLLWLDYVWVMVSAPYTLTEFVKGQRNVTTGGVDRLGLMPQQAIQRVTLKRVANHNLKTSEVLGKLFKDIDYGK